MSGSCDEVNVVRSQLESEDADLFISKEIHIVSTSLGHIMHSHMFVATRRKRIA